MADLYRAYVLVDPRDGEIRYVGITGASLRSRCNGHIKAARSREPSARTIWILELLQVGEHPLIRLLQEVSPQWKEEAERYWINHFKELGCKLTNSTEGGDGLSNPSPAVRQQLSAKMTERMKSEEERDAIRKRMRGREVSAETRAKQSAVRRGRILSPETRAKMAASRRAFLQANPDVIQKMSADRLAYLKDHPEASDAMRAARLASIKAAKTPPDED